MYVFGVNWLRRRAHAENKRASALAPEAITHAHKCTYKVAAALHMRVFVDSEREKGDEQRRCVSSL